jgi:hypothetical protein
MLRNKKNGIKLFALILVLLMTASVFAGCNNKALQEAIDAAKDQADAANQAAANAQAAADAAQQLADDLKNQLDSANDEIDKQKDANDKLQEELDKAKDEIESIKNEPDPDIPDGIDPGDWDDISDLISASVLEELTQMKVKYTVQRQLWYTEDNYLKLYKLFDDAYTSLYRATTAEGVNQVLAKIADEAAKVPSIMNEAEAVQAVIRSFGDVDTQLFTAHEEIVEKAREDYIAWLTTYSKYFTSVGYSVDNYLSETVSPADVSALDGHVMNTFNIATSTLRYAESKLRVLKNYAARVATDAYDAIQAIMTDPTFTNIKGEYDDIEQAFELYKIFMIANGGDDSPIQKKDTNNKVLLTGEEFVKNYVLVLYDNWFHQYQSRAKALIDSLPTFFMNNGATPSEFNGLDTTYLGAYLDAELLDDYTVDYKTLTESYSTDQQLLNEFERIATLNNAEFLKLTFSGDFKGTLNIDEAYDQVDAAVAKAVADMAQLYYNEIVAPDLEAKVSSFKAKANAYLNSTDADAVYKNLDKTFGNAVVSKVDTYFAGLAQFKVPTYAQIDDIDDLKVFNRNVVGGDVSLTLNTNPDTSAFIAVLKALNKTVKEVADYYVGANEELDELIAFHDFKKALSKEIKTYADLIGNTAGTIVTKANEVRTKQGAAALTTAEKNTYNTAIASLATSARDAIMALDYNTYAETTYQAQSTGKKPLYYQKKAAAEATLTETATSNVALTIVVDKLVVAKDAAVDAAKQYADQMFNTMVNLFRTQVVAHINAAKAAYAGYLDDSDSLSLATDINSCITTLTAIAEVNAITDFKNDSFSNKNNQINITTYANIAALTAGGTNYYLETVGTNQYLVHIRGTDYTTVDKIISDATETSSYAKLADTKFNEVRKVVLDDTDAASYGGAFERLENARQLAFYKDEIILDLGDARDEVKGVWNASTGQFTTNPKYEYNYASSRTARYLQEVDAAYERLVAEVKKITITTSGVAGSYVNGKAKVDAIYALRFADQDNQKAATSKDDLSFKVAYDRYYATSEDGTPVYNWATYYGIQ